MVFFNNTFYCFFLFAFDPKKKKGIHSHDKFCEGLAGFEEGRREGKENFYNNKK